MVVCFSRNLSVIFRPTTSWAARIDVARSDKTSGDSDRWKRVDGDRWAFSGHFPTRVLRPRALRLAGFTSTPPLPPMAHAMSCASALAARVAAPAVRAPPRASRARFARTRTARRPRRTSTAGASAHGHGHGGSDRRPGEKGFVEEMRFVAMKLHTREQAPKEGEKKPEPKPEQQPMQKWEPTKEKYLKFLVESKAMYEAMGNRRVRRVATVRRVREPAWSAPPGSRRTSRGSRRRIP